MEHRVFTSLTKPVTFLGVPLPIILLEGSSIVMIRIFMQLHFGFLIIPVLFHFYAMYMTSLDGNWHKAVMIQGKYFSKGRSLFKKESIRYNA
tara:strand:- start:177 stop:452 length:276 start_codon:yes stop_codon:yes gene_type:complete